MSDHATPETDAVWSDKSRNILTHAQNLERQRDEAREERNIALAKLEMPERSQLSRSAAPCAYCGQSTPPEDQATPPWHWPKRGLVTNCWTCSGEKKPR